MKRRDCSPVLFWRPSRTWPAGRRRYPHRSIASLWIVLSVISVESISGIDLNNDGMSDVWQQKYSVPSADASLDYDGTGLTNSQKSPLGVNVWKSSQKSSVQQSAVRSIAWLAVT